MGKNKKRKRASKHLEEVIMMQKKKKQQLAEQEAQAKTNEEDDGEDDRDDLLVTISAPSGGEENNDSSSVSISQRNLQIAIETLQKIPPHLVQSSPVCRELRRALHPHVLQQMQSYEVIDYRVKVTTALSQQQWPNALVALQGCRDFKQIPKQGTVQRWVRDCNESPSVWKLKLLTAILSLKNNENTDDNNNQHDPGRALASAAAVASESNNGDDLIILEPWSILLQDETEKSQTAKPPTDKEEDTPELPEFPILDSQKCIIYQEEASERKPPNNYDLLLHYTPEPLIQLASSDNNYIQKHTLDFLKQDEKVTTPFVLQSVLTQEECTQFMAAATTLGYRPDHPTSMEHPTGIDSCEWLMAPETLSLLLKRVQPHLPETIRLPNNSSFGLHSINARWRFFRYAQNCVYRPHIDGSWPASFVHRDEKSSCGYTYSTESSSSSEEGETRSYLTFLIYLNDDFQGGETRFYQPNQDGSKMTARGITPHQGAVLVFPQGNTASLIHEGSAVTKGTKYVVRTDVIYVQKN